MKPACCRGLLPLFCGLIVFCVSPAYAEVVQPEAAESGSVIVTAETAEVREGPSTGAEVMTIVEKGEIFQKLGRTRGWYYVQINEESSGWVSGRAISTYRGEQTPAPYVAPAEEPAYPYNPGPYFDFSLFYWGWPYLYWEWPYYGHAPGWGRPWIHDPGPRLRGPDRPPGGFGRPDVDRPGGGVWRGDGRPQGDGRPGDVNPFGGRDVHRGGDAGGPPIAPPRSSGPHIRAPFPRR